MIVVRQPLADLPDHLTSSRQYRTLTVMKTAQVSLGKGIVVFVGCALAWAGSGQPAATADDEGAELFAAAKKTHGVTGTSSLRTLRLTRDKYAGKTVEVTGMIVGRISAGERTTYLLQDGGVTEYLDCDQSLPELVNGRQVRALVTVPDTKTGGGRLRLVAAAAPAPVQEATGPNETGGAATAASLPSRGVARARTVPTDQTAAQERPTTIAPQAAVRLTTAADLRSRTAQLRPSYAACIRRFNSKLSQDYANWIADIVLRFSLQHQLDPRLVIAIVAAESNFKLTATSPKGAMGLGQLMPGTAAGMGVSNAYDPEQNLAAAIKILRGNLDRYRGYGDKQFAMALAAYNAGSGAVKRHGGVPPYRETVNYIWKVYRLYRGLAPDMFK
ncbi:MAG: hypothetical protein AUJ96_25320 [Armatimonadetes bacterium CG2_30_66_41]|nr:MAG: hypothetical protein AUJ96_25320 [Armatimonadetes bacterium CG2_30_66_41]